MNAAMFVAMALVSMIVAAWVLIYTLPAARRIRFEHELQALRDSLWDDVNLNGEYTAAARHEAETLIEELEGMALTVRLLTVTYEVPLVASVWKSHRAGARSRHRSPMDDRLAAINDRFNDIVMQWYRRRPGWLLLKALHKYGRGSQTSARRNGPVDPKDIAGMFGRGVALTR